MKRIRSITAAGVLTGATVLGGVGLAGATSTGGEDEIVQDPALVEQATDERSTGEPDAPLAPGLEEHAADAARTALAERFAGAGAGQEDPAGEERDEAPEDGADIEDGSEQHPDDPGAHVSRVARNG